MHSVFITEVLHILFFCGKKLLYLKRQIFIQIHEMVLMILYLYMKQYQKGTKSVPVKIYVFLNIAGCFHGKTRYVKLLQRYFN